MDPSAVAVLITAAVGAITGGTGLLQSRRSDQRGEIASLWEENRKLRGDLENLDGQVSKLRSDVERCQSEKTDLAQQLALLKGPGR